jgi:hypothetical protein
MAVSLSKNPFARNHSEGPTMKPTNRVTSLEFNISNMRIGRLKIGSASWRRALYKQLNQFGFEELAD